MSHVPLHLLVALFGPLQRVQAFLQVLQSLFSLLQSLLQLHPRLNLHLRHTRNTQRVKCVYCICMRVIYKYWALAQLKRSQSNCLVCLDTLCHMMN